MKKPNTPRYQGGFAWIPAAIAGAASLIGGERRNQANARESEKNRDFQEDMSSTAYTRAVADLKNAGLNPILAARQPASSPGGSMASFGNVGLEAVQGAAAGAAGAKEVKNISKIEAEVINLAADANLKTTQEMKAMAERALRSLEYNQKLMYMDLLEAEIDVMTRKGDIAKTKGGEILMWIKEIREALIGGSTTPMLQKKR